MNTLFRSQSLAIKMMNELMRVYGHYYLVKTIKPVLDTVSITDHIVDYSQCILHSDIHRSIVL